MIKECTNKLKEHGIAATSQRAYILKSMQTRTDHPDAEAVCASLRVTLPALSLDTVYRTLELFAEKGLIQKLAVPTHRFRFEGHMHAHDHFLCTQCETIFDVDCDESCPLSIPLTIAGVGEVHVQQRILIGTCHACAEREVSNDGQVWSHGL